MNKNIYKLIVILTLSISIWVYLSGAFSDVIDVDAAQYASISMEMYQNNSYLKVTERGQDYLGKPPFLFWICSISFKLFGLNNFAYKLPTLLFSLICLFYTYKLGEYLYSVKTGKIAAIILATTIGFFWINNDVKTDAIVTSCIIFSVYYLILFIETNRLIHIILASIGIGIGMLTKGPLGLLFPIAILFIHLIIKKKSKTLFRFNWIILPIIVILILSPMLIGLYNQFDMHPEKLINGKTGVGGLRFYFWEQSFGRIIGENKWNNNTSFLYLFHTLILLIFPYSLILLISYFKRIKQIIKTKYQDEYYLLGGSIIILIALSLSSYKIPHYTVVVFPLISIIIAGELINIIDSQRFMWLKAHNLVMSLLVFCFIFISFLAFDVAWYHIVTVLVLMTSFVFLHKYNEHLKSLFIIGLTIGFIFNVYLLPNIQKYSEGRRFVELIKVNKIQYDQFYFFNRDSRAIEFYLNSRIKQISWDELLEKQRNKENAWYYMSLDGKEALLNAGLKIEDELCLMQYDMNRLKIGFINPLTRERYLEPRFLIKFKTN